ncbi:M55 family metallopeptidase [Fusibacter sp. 3D3]|uniref:M55 family metallopeptidase n=1 Tax=Fusibacter sp. 3D3 TaxID=1048380 RepID=UPI00085334E3|nr:M55 family metallopeptidase [Fusibacter sp. 3D3]GAU77223.1 D-aminopeptidase dipeptide-binding protein DppA [Fusibacter sp. 3D3]
MKLYVSSDMEGIAGVVSWDEVDASHRSYEWAKNQMTKEVQVVCETAIELGSEKVLVKDAHDTGRNINISELPSGVLVHRAWTRDPLIMMSGVDDGYDAVVFTGYHAGAYSDGSPLAHTMNSTSMKWLKMNGLLMSEFMMNAYTAAYYKVPVIAITGDQAICEEAKQLIPEITTIAVKSCKGSSCITMTGNNALVAIEDGIRVALKKYKLSPNACELALPDQMTFEINFANAGLAYRASQYKGVELVDACTIRYSTADYYEFLRMFFFAC